MGITIEITSNAIGFLTGESTTSSITELIVDALGEFVDDFDVEAIEDDYREALQGCLPEDASLCGDFIYLAVYDTTDHDDVWEARGDVLEARDDIRAAAEQIDFWAIVESHDLSA